MKLENVKETKNEYKNNKIRFQINLGNGQSFLVYIKYKKSRSYAYISEGEENI